MEKVPSRQVRMVDVEMATEPMRTQVLPAPAAHMAQRIMSSRPRILSPITSMKWVPGQRAWLQRRRQPGYTSVRPVQSQCAGRDGRRDRSRARAADTSAV